MRTLYKVHSILDVRYVVHSGHCLSIDQILSLNGCTLFHKSEPHVHAINTQGTLSGQSVIYSKVTQLNWTNNHKFIPKVHKVLYRDVYTIHIDNINYYPVEYTEQPAFPRLSIMLTRWHTFISFIFVATCSSVGSFHSSGLEMHAMHVHQFT